MKLTKIWAVLMMGGALAGPVFAEPPSQEPVRDRIRALAQGVPFEAVNASPRDDIIAHIEGMGRRGGTQTAFAVPDLDLELIASSASGVDVLMDPRILDAISRMTPERATQVLRLIEDRKNGVTVVPDIPSLSGRGAETSQDPPSLVLRGWALDRDASGAPFIQNGSDPASRIMIVPSMILGDLGRVLSVEDDGTVFRVTLEGGDVLEGEPLGTAALEGGGVGTDPVASEAVASEAVRAEIADEVPALTAPSAAPTRSLRPRPRPEGLAAAAPAPVTNSAAAETQTEPQRSARPRARPAELAVVPPSDPEKDEEDAS